MDDWRIDLEAATATHTSGLVVRFVPAPDTPGAFDGRLEGAPPGNLTRDPAVIARLMREAGDAFIAARAARH